MLRFIFCVGPRGVRASDPPISSYPPLRARVVPVRRPVHSVRRIGSGPLDGPPVLAYGGPMPMPELLRRGLGLALVAEVARVLVYVQPAFDQRCDMVDLSGQPRHAFGETPFT